MSFQISGLPAAPFTPLFGLSDEALAAQGVIRRTVTAKPGFPCRISLEDAEPGESVLLLHHVSHDVETPYRSAYAIYVRETAQTPAFYRDEIPPVMKGRPIALRIFNADGHLIGADLSLQGDVADKIERALAQPGAAYLHAHNAAHGCFAARIDPA